MPTQSRKKTEPTPSAPPKAKKKRSTPVSLAKPSPQPQGDAQGVEDKYAPTAWGSAASETGGPVDLELPSGQLVLARKPGLQQLMVEGVLHKMDNLTALVDGKHVKKVKGKPDQLNVQSLAKDPETLASILHTVDRVLCAVVIKPHVEMAPSDVTRRQQGHIYSDTVEIQDKMFIFNWALGGSRDIERFRRESREVVGSLAVGEPVEHEAE